MSICVGRLDAIVGPTVGVGGATKSTPGFVFIIVTGKESCPDENPATPTVAALG